MAIAELSDADVFGTPPVAAPAPTGAPKELSDADVFGAPAAPTTAAGEFGYAPAPTPTIAAAPKVPAVSDAIVAPTEYGQAYAAPASAEPAPGNAAIERVGRAAAEAYRATPSFFMPAAQEAIDRYGGPVGQQIVNPAGKIVGGAIGAANAGMAGLSQGAMELLGEKGGRDALALASVLPMVRGEAMSPNPAVRVPDEPASRPQFVSERMAPDVSQLDPRNAITELINHDVAENPVISGPPGRGLPNQRTPVLGSPESALNRAAATPLADTANVPTTATGAPQTYEKWLALNQRPTQGDITIQGAAPAPAARIEPTTPRSVGAAALDDNGLGELTPAQERAYAATAEGQKLLERQPVGVPDHSSYVPGVNPTDVERLQSVDAARELKALKVTAPNVAQEIQNVADANMEKRQAYHQATIGSPVDILTATEARNAQRAADYPVAFANKTTPNIEPVVNAVQDSLSSPRARQNTQLRQYVKPLLDRLVNEDGSPKITDAEELYGFREDLNRMRSKASQIDQPNLQHVSGELGDIIKATDAAIEQAAPGYRAYMDNFANASRRIDEMQVLQDHEPKLYDAQNRFSYAKFQAMMRQIVDARASRGINPYKSITPETMARLWNLRDDLRRMSKAGELGSAAGSDTAQNAFDMIKGAVGGQGGTIASTIAAGVLAGPIGAGVVGFGKDLIGSMLAKRTLRRQTARGMEILHPASPLNDLLPGELAPEVRPPLTLVPRSNALLPQPNDRSLRTESPRNSMMR